MRSILLGVLLSAVTTTAFAECPTLANGYNIGGRDCPSRTAPASLAPAGTATLGAGFDLSGVIFSPTSPGPEYGMVSCGVVPGTTTQTCAWRYQPTPQQRYGFERQVQVDQNNVRRQEQNQDRAAANRQAWTSIAQSLVYDLGRAGIARLFQNGYYGGYYGGTTTYYGTGALARSGDQPSLGGQPRVGATTTPGTFTGYTLGRPGDTPPSGGQSRTGDAPWYSGSPSFTLGRPGDQPPAGGQPRSY